VPAFEKGHKKVGGRRPGSRNKSTLIQAEAAQVAADTSESAIDYMLRVMRDPTAPADRRDRMAAAVAPYIHPRLTAVATKVDATVYVLSEEERAAKEAESKRIAIERFQEAFGLGPFAKPAEPEPAKEPEPTFPTRRKFRRPRRPKPLWTMIVA
jgi:hypothetical protein